MSATAPERSGRQAHPGTGSGARQAPARRRASRARTAGRPAPRAAKSAPLRLVAADGRLIPQAPAEPVRTSPGTGQVPRQPARPLPGAPLPDAQPSRTAPLRLTRRGRLVAAAGAVLVTAAISVGLAGAAQALGHSGAPARPGTGLTRVQVRPGQSLWSLAEEYDPNADTRAVIREILQLNSMSTSSLQPGQVLWMPRG